MLAFKEVYNFDYVIYWANNKFHNLNCNLQQLLASTKER